MDCFTSPTIKLSAPWDKPSSSNRRKLSHCIREVSWNSSIITLRMVVPIFSNTNEESPSFTRLWSNALVSDSRKRLFSWFNSRTSSSILASRRILFTWRRESWQELASILFRLLYFSDSFSRGISSFSARPRIALRMGEVFFTHSSGQSRHFSTVTLRTLSSSLPDCSLLK